MTTSPSKVRDTTRIGPFSNFSAVKSSIYPREMKRNNATSILITKLKAASLINVLSKKSAGPPSDLFKG